MTEKERMRPFLWAWMDDVGRTREPDLAEFRPLWAEANRVGILDYQKFMLYKEQQRQRDLMKVAEVGVTPSVHSDFVKTMKDTKPTEAEVTQVVFEPSGVEKNKVTENMENIDWDKVQWGVHQFSTASIIFRGTEEECQQYIADRKELWDDAEVYFMTPDDPHYLKEETEEKKICSICGEEYEGWGNNAWPYNDGRCCDSCNYLFVLPERIKHIQKKKETPDVSEAFDELNKLDD